MAIKLAHYIGPECFITNLAEGTLEEVLHRILRAVVEKGLVKDEADIFAKLMKRENARCTAVGNGIAVLHCFTDGIPDLIIIVARVFGGIVLHSFDHRRTQVVFLLMGNLRAYNLHVHAFARIARLINNTTFIDKVASSTSTQDVARAFDEEEAKIS